MSTDASKASWTRFDDVLLTACALFPASLAAAFATSAAPASHDEGIVRAVGLGWTGLFRGLDAAVAAPLMLLPIGTRALRAGLASALVLGACGAVGFVIARGLLTSGRPASASPRLHSAVAAVAVLSALLAPVWQAEGASPGGTVTGALIVLIAIALAAKAHAEEAATADANADVNPDADADVNAGGGVRGVALALGLAVSYEPLVAAAALAAAAPWLHGIARVRPITRRVLVEASPAFGLGLLPMALAAALARRSPEVALAAATALASPLGEGGGRQARVGAWATEEIGFVLLGAAAVGVVLGAIVPTTRRWLASLLGVVLVGAVAHLLGAPAGPWHASAALLAATFAVHVLAAIALAAAVVAIGAAPVPFAQASAALVVVLELVLPVRAVDETLGRRESRSPRASMVWNEVAWGAAPPAAVVLVSESTTMRRIAAARAVGQMRDDLLIVPTFALPSRVTGRALAAEPKLAPLYRDVALGSTPEELSLAQLASQRPLLAGFDPRWDRNLARHFVPVGLTSRFEPEPRGSSDRRRALDAFAASKERLVHVVVAKRDPDLATATASLLRGRAIEIAACGERDLLSRALDDLRPFAPDDVVASTLVRRLVTSKGPIEVRDLTP